MRKNITVINVGDIFVKYRKESHAHRYTKTWLAEKIQSAGEKINVSLFDEDNANSGTYCIDLTGMRPIVECAYPDAIAVPDVAMYFAIHGRYPQMIFDVGMVDEDGHVVGAFEVVKTNPLSWSKIAKIVRANLYCFELDVLSVDKEGSYIDTGRIDAKRLVLPSGARGRVWCSNAMVGLARGA